MRRFVSLWPAALSAILVLAAFPPSNLGLLVFVGLTPLLVALMKGGAKRALATGYMFGFVYMMGQMMWLQGLVSKWTSSVPLSLLVWVLCGFLGAWYFALFGWLANRCFRNGWPWLIPLLWAGIEVFRSYIPGLAFPWGLLADPLWFIPSIIQSAYFGSIFLVSAWCALLSLILGFWYVGESWRRIRPYATAFCLVLIASLFRFSTPLTGKHMTVTIGQPGVNMAFPTPDMAQRMSDAMQRITWVAVNTKSDLLVFPEGFGDASTQMPPTTPAPIDPRVPIIFGAERGTKPTYQSVFSYDGSKWNYADKTRLVIFGEYVPGRDWIPFLSAFQLPSGDLTPGKKLETLDVKGTKIGPLVCFEGMFPDVAYRQAAQGAQLLVVVSIDDWYMGTSAPDQLASESVWRAVETGLPLVRSASLGHTMAIDGHGNVISEAHLGETVGLHAEIQVPDKPSPFQLYAVFSLLSLVAILVAFLTPWLPKKAPLSDIQAGKKLRK